MAVSDDDLIVLDEDDDLCDGADAGASNADDAADSDAVPIPPCLHETKVGRYWWPCVLLSKQADEAHVRLLFNDDLHWVPTEKLRAMGTISVGATGLQVWWPDDERWYPATVRAAKPFIVRWRGSGGTYEVTNLAALRWTK